MSWEETSSLICVNECELHQKKKLMVDEKEGYPLLESLEISRQNGVALGNHRDQVRPASDFLHCHNVQGLQTRKGERDAFQVKKKKTTEEPSRKGLYECPEGSMK